MNQSEAEQSRKKRRAMTLAVWIVIGLLSVFWVKDQMQSERLEFPNKAIEVVVPYPAGGGSDTFVRRVIQQGIDEGGLLDVPLVVINLPGGGGTIGSREVKNSRPDGYRILCHHTSMMSSQLAGTVNFGPDDFAAFAQTGENTMIVMVREDSPYPSLRDLLEAAAENPKTLTFGANVGSAAYFITLQLEKAVPGAAFSTVSADGGADRYNRLLGGHLDAGIFSLSEYLDFRDSDETPADRNVKALAVIGERRHPAIPDAATTVEQDLPVTFSNAYYWWAAKDTPAEIQSYLADVLEKTMATDMARSEMDRLRIEPTFLRGEAVAESIRETMQSFESVVVEEERNVPDFAKYVRLIVLVLFVVVIFVSLYERRHQRPNESLKAPRETYPQHYGRAALCFFVLVGYVLILVLTPIPFAPASIVMVFTVGGIMSGWNRRYLATIAQLAFLVGFGAEFVFTKVFTVPLP